MRALARYVFHLLRNIGLRKYRYFRISPNETGTLRFYDRDTKRTFTLKSRGFIDSATSNQVLTNSEYNFDFIGRTDQIQNAYERILAAGRRPLIVDCGANIGASTIHFALRYPKALIIAVEPDSANIEQARANCLGLENINFEQAAIGSRTGWVAIEDPDVDPNAFRVERSETSTDIPVRTIEQLELTHDNAELFIVKVDIEGFELDLFESNIDWIERTPIVVVELHDWMLPNQAISRTFLRAIAPLDRDFLFHGESAFSIRND